MQRYFIPANNWINHENVVIDNGDYHHIVHVMRMNVHDQIICCNTEGKSALCEITKIVNEKVYCHVVKWLEENKELPVHVTIVQGLPKGDKLELIVQKGTELGAFAFLPFQAERSIVKWDQKKAKKKIDRLQKIVKEASEQSHRTRIPIIYDVHNISELLELSKNYNHKIVASEMEAKKDNPVLLKNIIKNIDPGDHVLIVIGPEGGFSDQELELFAKHEFHFARLGPRILRTETASLYFLSTMSYEFEELG
jgi:16S rRNA (uracil1498-N3)-methyltransferase